MIRRGEIYWADLNPTIGSEISKKRPVLFLSNDRNNQYANTVMILPITSSTDKIYPFEVFLKASDANLKNDSKVKANQIRTIDKQRRLESKIGQLNAAKIKEVEQAILIHLDIEL